MGDLSSKLLGKSAAAQAGLIAEEEEKQKQLGGAPPLNPFRSKPRAAPVATEPDPPPMESSPLEFNLQHTPMTTMPEPEMHQQLSQPSQEQQMAPYNEMRREEPEKPSGGGFSNDGPPGLAPGLHTAETPREEPKQRLWSPSAQDLADLGVPPGIAVRMIRLW